MFFEMHQGLENVFVTKERPGLQNTRVRINVPPTPILQNVILAFFGNICVSLLDKLVPLTSKCLALILFIRSKIFVNFFEQKFNNIFF